MVLRSESTQKTAKSAQKPQNPPKTTKSTQKLQNSHKICGFWPQICRFCVVLSLKLENCSLVLSPERGSKGETSIFPWKSAKTTKSTQELQNLWILAKNLWILQILRIF